MIESRDAIFDVKDFYLFLDLEMQILIILKRSEMKYKIFNMTMLRIMMFLNLGEVKE